MTYIVGFLFIVGLGFTLILFLQIITKPRLQDLVREVNPTIQLDEEVEEILLFLADDFVDNCLESACRFAKHRHASTVELKDIQLHLGKLLFYKYGYY